MGELLLEHYSSGILELHLAIKELFSAKVHNTIHSPGSMVDFSSLRNLLCCEARKECHKS